MRLRSDISAAATKTVKEFQSNSAEAIKWYTKAANVGNADAQLDVCACLYNGISIDIDECEAVKWITRAAENGVVSG